MTTNGTAVYGIHELDSERKVKGQSQMHCGFKNTPPRSEKTAPRALFLYLPPQGDICLHGFRDQL